jgi:uncharacterized membrane protein
MTNLKHLLITNLNKGFIILSFLGFLDATYLTILHYQNIIPPCSLVKGCETVLTSKYAVIGSFPVALLGSIYYLLMIILGILYYQKKVQQIFRLLLLFVFIAVISNMYFFYLQAFVIKAFCQFCLTNEGIILLQVVTIFTIKRSQRILKSKE